MALAVVSCQGVMVTFSIPTYYQTFHPPMFNPNVANARLLMSVCLFAFVLSLFHQGKQVVREDLVSAL